MFKRSTVSKGLLIVCVCLLLSGCILFQNIPKITSFRINQGTEETTNPAVTLDNACEGKPTEYLAAETADFSGAVWQAYSPNPSFSLSAALGVKQVFFKVRNAKGEQSAVVSDTIQLNAPPPQLIQFDINEGAATSPTRDVLLSHDCANAPEEYMASESASFDGASWETWIVAPPFTLSPGNGVKTIYMKLRNSGGGESETLSDTIELQEPPEASVVLYDNRNGAAVDGAPVVNTVITFNSAVYVARIATDHILAPAEETPGTLQLVRGEGAIYYGPWSMTPSDAPEGKAEGLWEVRPDICIPSGTYTVVDSKPESWSQNVQSGGKGFCLIEGAYLQSEFTSFGPPESTLEAYGMKIVAPEGTGPATFTLGLTAVDRSASINPFVVSHHYLITGLPDSPAFPLEIHIPLLGPVSGETYLVLSRYNGATGEAGGTAINMDFPVFLPASIESGMAHATINPSEAIKGVPFDPLANGEKIGINGEGFDRSVRVVTSGFSGLSANRHFMTHCIGEQLTISTNQTLEEAFSLLTQQGLAFPEDYLPIHIYVDDFNSVFHTILRNDPKETYGCFFSLTGAIYLNRELLMSTDAAIKEDMRATMIHELFHAFQEHYGSNPLWIDEAFAVWSEWLMCGGAYQPGVTGPKALDATARFPMNGLFNDTGTAVEAAAGGPSPQRHGYAASVFMRYLQEHDMESGAVGEFFSFLRSLSAFGEEGRAAFVHYLAGNELGEKWRTFTESMYGGQLDYCGGAQDMALNADREPIVINNAAETSKSIPMSLQNYSAQLKRIRLAYPNPAAVKPSNMVILGAENVEAGLWKLQSGQLTLQHTLGPGEAISWPNIDKAGPLNLVLLATNGDYIASPTFSLFVFPRDISQEWFTETIPEMIVLPIPPIQYYLKRAYTLTPLEPRAYFRPGFLSPTEFVWFIRGRLRFDFHGVITDLTGDYIVDNYYLDTEMPGVRTTHSITEMGFQIKFLDSAGQIIGEPSYSEGTDVKIEEQLPENTSTVVYEQINKTRQLITNMTTGQIFRDEIISWGQWGGLLGGAIKVVRE